MKLQLIRQIAVLAALQFVPSSAFAENRGVSLQWEEVAGATAYDVEISADDAFGDAARFRTEEAALIWPEVPRRRYHWRVRTIDSVGRAGPWSAADMIPAVREPPQRRVRDVPTPIAPEPEPAAAPAPPIASEPAFAAAVTAASASVLSAPLRSSSTAVNVGVRAGAVSNFALLHALSLGGELDVVTRSGWAFTISIDDVYSRRTFDHVVATLHLVPVSALVGYPLELGAWSVQPAIGPRIGPVLARVDAGVHGTRIDRGVAAGAVARIAASHPFGPGSILAFTEFEWSAPSTTTVDPGHRRAGLFLGYRLKVLQ